MLPVHTFVDRVPLWGVFILTLVVVLAALEAGYRFGRRRHVRVAEEKEGPVGAMVGSALALLAFLLGFTYSFAAGRVDARRTALIDEVNAISTTYLRADMLPDPHRGEVRALLREYVDSRLEVVRTHDFVRALARADELQEKLWVHAVSIGRENPGSEVFALFIASLNETIDAHARRALGARTRVSSSTWAVLFTLVVLGFVAQGYHNGISETTRSPAMVAIAVAFSLVIWLVADLDRPYEGTVTVSQQAMIDLQTFMKKDIN